MEDTGFFTYLLGCADGTYYTGWTNNLQKRVKTHNSGKGGKYTRARLPVQLLGYWQFQSQSEAMKFEYWLKQLPRQQKTQLLKTEAVKP